jgi:hypothetical protein
MHVFWKLKRDLAHPDLTDFDPNEARRRLLLYSISLLAVPALF